MPTHGECKRTCALYNAKHSLPRALSFKQAFDNLARPSPTSNSLQVNPATMSDPVKEQIAQDKYGKGFEELDSREKQSVGGTKGGQVRKEQMADAHGGDATAGYKEMGAKGGAVSNEDTGKA